MTWHQTAAHTTTDRSASGSRSDPKTWRSSSSQWIQSGINHQSGWSISQSKAEDEISWPDQALRVCLHVKRWLFTYDSFMSRREESTSAAEKKESSEVMVVASSSRRLRTLSTWGKIRVPSLSVENSKKNVIVGGSKYHKLWNKWPTADKDLHSGPFYFFSFSFLSYLWKPNTTRTEVCQHTFRWNAAAKIFLQVVRSVQQRLQLLSKHFVVGFTLNTKWEEKHEALRTLTWCKNSITLICSLFFTTKYILYRDIKHHIEQPQKHHKCKSSETSLPQEDLHKLPPQEQGCCCWTLRGSDGEYSAPVPTSAALPQTAPSLVRNQQRGSNQELVCV